MQPAVPSPNRLQRIRCAEFTAVVRLAYARLALALDSVATRRDFLNSKHDQSHHPRREDSLRPLAGRSGLLEAVRGAEARYASLGVSGVTIITPKRFAQLFEGPPDTIDELFAAVRDEWPGADMRVVEERLTVSRRFDGWKMAFYGTSGYIDRHIDRSAADNAGAEDQYVIQKLRNLMEEFAAQARAEASSRASFMKAAS